MREAQILATMQGNVAIITLNDPASLNAVSVPMVAQMNAALDALLPEARALILTGAGRGFCSGANMAGGPVPFAGKPVPDMEILDAGETLKAHYNPFVSRLRDLPIPFITAVHGAAAGIGCSFALLGDIVIAADDAYFLQAFRRIGLVPDGGSTYMLTRAIGRARAMEMMLLGEKIPAAQALQWGLINRVVPADRLMAEATALAQSLAQGPTQTLRLIRRAAWAAMDLDWEQSLQLERDNQAQAGRSDDFKEGVSAFLAKRPARFAGS